eukprot:CAMPEP_0206801136 /NCGR_PEP_ID=MMETSP0975-20121206/2049_1 /ASSEMBLY_ACC=CAM_ASM_000399 /TAXON_ID=483370 /ORGANISM="non described non described, Strain CCMP2097" /LENGTH=117 /DNA_ID=CAMNT_0054343143 /DNA_START=83 /DNA_END=436 /DNA_ORIENTATION=-
MESVVEKHERRPERDSGSRGDDVHVQVVNRVERAPVEAQPVVALLQSEGLFVLEDLQSDLFQVFHSLQVVCSQPVRILRRQALRDDEGGEARVRLDVSKRKVLVVLEEQSDRRLATQ